MKLAVKCEGCRMWSMINTNILWFMEDYANNRPYYCDECMQNVTYHETKATITFE